MTFRVPEKFRITTGPMASSAACGNNGAFRFPAAPGRPALNVVASDGEGWEQVSEAFADDPDVVALYRAPVAVAEICESPFMDGVLRMTRLYSSLPAGTKLYAWVDDDARFGGDE